MRGANDNHVSYWRVLSQRLVSEDGSFDFLCADSVPRYVDNVVRATMECEGAVVVLTCVVALRISEFTTPSIEIYLCEAVDIATPAVLK